MQRRLIVLVAVVSFLAVSNARADEGGAASAGQLLKARLDLVAKQGELQRQQYEETAPLQQKSNGLYQQLSMLKGPPPTEAQVTALKRQADALKAQLESVEAQIQLADLKDPAQRAAKVKELEAQQQEISREVQKKSEPTQKKMDALAEPLRKTDPAFCDALSAYFKDGTGKAAGLKVGKVTWMSNNTGQVHWKDAAGNDAVWGGIFLSPGKNAGFGSTKIDNKYSDSSNPPGYISVWVGHFQVMLTVNSKTLQGDQAALAELVKNLVDLAGLDAIDPGK